MIGHRLGHLNFTVYRKQRGPPNHGVNVNDARIRRPFRRTRKLNDNDILRRRRAEILAASRPEHLFSSPGLSLLSSPFLPSAARVRVSPSPSTLPSFPPCVFCSVKILVNSNHDPRVLYEPGTEFPLFPGLNKSLEAARWPSAG